MGVPRPRSEGVGGGGEEGCFGPGAIMSDIFYAQVCAPGVSDCQVLAYSLGLGTLLQNETRLN